MLKEIVILTKANNSGHINRVFLSFFPICSKYMYIYICTQHFFYKRNLCPQKNAKHILIQNIANSTVTADCIQGTSVIYCFLIIVQITWVHNPKVLLVICDLPLPNNQISVQQLFDNTDRSSHYSCLLPNVRTKQLTLSLFCSKKLLYSQIAPQLQVLSGLVQSR